MDLKQLLAALRAAESANRPALLTEHAAVLEANGLTADQALRLVEAAPPAAPAPAPAPAGDQPRYLKSSIVGQGIVRTACEAANLGAHMVEAITAELPEQFTESEVTGRVASAQKLLAGFERSLLEPTVPAAEPKVTESLDKKIKALDAYFAGDTINGFRSFKEAFISIAGELGPQVKLDPFSADFNRRVMRESAVMSVGGGRESYDSMRSTESLTTTSWGEILGDSITRRMVAEYGLPSLQTWRQIVSSIYTVNDFRTQRIDRLGGYGVLPTVLESAPYQALTSPTDEEVTYAVTKKGGTDDLTLEMVTNDDMRSITRIPTKLGRAAAQTLYRFVWDLLDTNPTLYDGVALFHATHANTAANALSGANLSTARRNMRKQAAYGDSSELLSLTPAFLVVVSELEELAYEIATSAVAMPSGAPVGAATNTPNIHQGIKPIVVDYWTSTTKWIAVADPALCPTIEVGFLSGQQEPSLFVQNDPNNGSAFSADKITYKVRHIYGGAVVDYRPFQRGNS